MTSAKSAARMNINNENFNIPTQNVANLSAKHNATDLCGVLRNDGGTSFETYSNLGKSRKTRKAGDKDNEFRRTFKVRWLALPEVKDWIKILPDRSNFIGCKWCNVELRAHLSDLKKHASSTKHRKYILKSSKLDSIGTVESIAVETVDCQHGTACLERNILISEDECIQDINKQDPLSPMLIGFIGAGNIAQALISGFLSSGVIDANNVIVSAPSDRNLSKLRLVGLRTTHENNLVVQESDLVFLALKPQIVAEALANIDPIIKTHSPLFVSVVTGLSIIHLEGMLSSHSISSPRVIRLIPNTPCMVLQGSSVYSLGVNTTASEADLMKNLLGSLGHCSELPENQLDAASAVCSSGPAYIYAAIDAIADGGVKMGIPRHIAVILAAQMVKGAATMVLETGRHPCQLKDEVCCPSGNAIAAMHVLERNGFRNSLMSAVETATLKSNDLEN